MSNPVHLVVPKRFDLKVFLENNDPEKEDEENRRKEAEVQKKLQDEAEKQQFADFEIKSKEYEEKIARLESKLQKIYKKIDKKRGIYILSFVLYSINHHFPFSITLIVLLY